MTVDRIRNHWRADMSATPGNPSAPVIFPRRFGTAVVKVMPESGGTAEIEYTLDDPSDVMENPGSANWEVWDPGTVSVDTTRSLVSVVGAIRLVAYLQPAAGQVVMSWDY